LQFIGVDLAWAVDRKHTGVAVMEGDHRGVQLTALSTELRSLRNVVEFVCSRAGDDAVVAVDASLIVKNEVGQRPCESAIGRAFGRFGASCHSSNRGRPHFDSGERIVRQLAAAGFAHGLPLEATKRRTGRWLFEVYPHPALVRLFNLDRILRYKKGTVHEKRKGLAALRDHLRELLSERELLKPSNCLENLLSTDLVSLKGGALKCYEDLLDAVLCAYLAWHIWCWGQDRNEVFGDLETGYIVVPLPMA
jgi:predicted RNase H-like nuclease